MKRKTSEKETRIYSYGALPPVLGKDEASDQFYLAHRYQNDLIAIERARRFAWRAVHREHPEVAPSVEALEAAERAFFESLAELKKKRTGAGKNAKAETEEGVVKACRKVLWETEKQVVEMSRRVRKRIEESIAVQPEVVRAREEHDRARRPKEQGGLGLGPRSFVRAEIKQTMKLAEDFAFGELSAADRILARALAGIEVRAEDMVRRTRSASGLAPGTYMLVEKAMDATKAKPGIPRFKEADGEGRIGVHFGDGGILVSDLFAGNSNHLRVEGAIPRQSLREKNGGSPRKPRESDRSVRIRVGSNGRDPIWAVFPIILHREVPEGKVKDAWVLRRRVGIRYEYRFQFVIESEAFCVPSEPEGKGICVLNLGWRNLPDGGVRVGYLLDDAGHEEEIRLPDVSFRVRREGVPSQKISYSLREAIEKADSLRAIRDREFDLVRGFLVTWLEARSGTLPAWLVERVRYLTKWRATKKLVTLLRRWKAARFEGDEAIVAGLDFWAARDRHLLSWEAHQRSRRIGHRREMWRVLAVRLTRTYATLLVDEMDLRTFGEQPLPEEGVPSDEKTQRKTLRLAAPGEIREEIRRAGKKRGSRVIEDDEAYASQVHAGMSFRHRCGTLLVGDPRSSIYLRCEPCSEIVDQDANNCRNRLLWHASGGAASILGGPLAEGISLKKKKKMRPVRAEAKREAVGSKDRSRDAT